MQRNQQTEEKDFLLNLGRALKKIRVERDLSQFELAVEAGLPKNQIGRIERGEINTTVISLKKITVALDITLEHLFALID